MSKLINFSMVLLLMATSCAFAAMFNSTPAQSNPSVVSPDEFRKAVNQKHNEIMQKLNQQSQQSLPQPGTNNPNKNMNMPGNQPSDNQLPGNQSSAPSAIDNSFSSVNTPSSQSQSTQPGAGNSPARQPSQGYTGFGGGLNNAGTGKSNAPASSGKSGGWNINY